MERYILVIDQSTAGTKAILFDKDGKVANRFDVEHRQIIDCRGWVEHNPIEILTNLCAAVKGVINKAGIEASQVIAAGISNQRETSIIWDTTTGEPLYNAIVWQCARGKEICKRIESQGVAEIVRHKTGIPLSPYYSAAKIAWVLENVPAAIKGKQAGTICCSTMDSWLVKRLCGGTPKTDYSNASRTQLYNIHTLCWDEDVCDLFGIPVSALPEVVDSNSLFGYSDFDGIFPEPIPVHGVLGDSHGALFGQGCLSEGMVKATYGTGSSVMMNIGSKPVISDTGIVTSLAWGLDGKVDYVLEGNINYTGAVIKWLVDDVDLLENPRQAGDIAARAKSTSNVYLVPAFSGLGAPYWCSNAQTMICGMDRNTSKAEIVRAAEECIAYQITDILNLMRNEVNGTVSVLRVDGGATKDAFLMQFQADITRIDVHVSVIEELSGSGVAYVAGIAVGLYNPDSLFLRRPASIYTPQMGRTEAEKRYAGWKSAVDAVLYKAKEKI